MGFEAKINYSALKEYVYHIGGTIIEEDNRVEATIPITIEEIPGGVGFKIEGLRRGDELFITKCLLIRESEETIELDTRDLEQWIRYIESARTKSQGKPSV